MTVNVCARKNIWYSSSLVRLTGSTVWVLTVGRATYVEKEPLTLGG
jgi:hypothetical protein